MQGHRSEYMMSKLIIATVPNHVPMHRQKKQRKNGSQVITKYVKVSPPEVAQHQTPYLAMTTEMKYMRRGCLWVGGLFYERVEQ